MGKYGLKLREGPKVTRIRCATIDELFDQVERQSEEMSDRADGEAVSSMFREYEAIELVHGRIEVTIADSPFKHRRGGIDVRRDGSIEAFVGRTSRTVVEPTPGETIPQALRRELLKPVGQ